MVLSPASPGLPDRPPRSTATPCTSPGVSLLVEIPRKEQRRIPRADVIQMGLLSGLNDVSLDERPRVTHRGDDVEDCLRGGD
jgi:hypothetical protein